MTLTNHLGEEFELEWFSFGERDSEMDKIFECIAVRRYEDETDAMVLVTNSSGEERACLTIVAKDAETAKQYMATRLPEEHRTVEGLAQIDILCREFC